MIKYIDISTEDNGVEISSFHPGSLVKTAEYDPELKEFLSQLESTPNIYYLHINALGAGEYFSSNRNGDYFPEIALREYHKTFETNANLYRHHQNKPQLGHKIYGKVVYSFYNKIMHRVELVVEFNTSAAPDLKDRVDNGEHLAFSMGARVKYDECSICGNKAKQLVNYCEHLRHQMNAVLSDGRKVYAINRHPKFFDISFVTIPADKTAYMFSKVASFVDEEKIEKAIEEAEKNADILKRIPATEFLSASVDPKRLIVDSQPPMPKEMINSMAGGSKLNEILSTLLGLQIIPTRKDFQRIVLTSRGREDYADELDRRNEVFTIPTNTAPITPEDVFPCVHNKVLDNIRPHENYIKRAPLTKPIIVIRILEKMAGLDTHTQEGSSMEQSGGIPPIVKYKNPVLPLSILGGLYYGYAALAAKFRDPHALQKLVVEHPWLLPVLIGGVSYASVKGQQFFDKQAGLFRPNFGIRMGVSIPATYLYSGNMESKVRRGEPISNYGDLVRKHPLLMGILHGFAAGQGQKLITKTAQLEEKISDAFLTLPEEKFEEIYKIVVNT